MVEPMSRVEFRKRLGAYFKQLRLNEEMLQSEVAEHFGFDPSTWSRIEAGSVGVDIDRFVEICDWFNVNPRVAAERLWAFGRTEKSNEQQEQEQKELLPLHQKG